MTLEERVISGIDESFVVAEVQVCLRAILSNEDLAVLVGGHGAGVDVEIRIEFLNCDPDAAAREESADGGGGDALSDGTNDAAGYKDILCHASPIGPLR